MDVLERLKNRFSGDPREVLWRNAHLAGLLLVLLFAFWVRVLPAGTMPYLQALDPYALARMSEAIVTSNHLPVMDVWRYFPWATPTYDLTLGNIYIPAYLYVVVGPLTGLDFITYAKIVPAVFGALMVVVMYFIGKEAFNKNVGLAASFFLASSASILHRSSAGWFEKEPIGGMFMLVSMYFFLRAWKRTDWRYGIVAGISLAVAKTAWGGTAYFYLLFPLAAFLVLFINEDVEKIVAAYTPTILLGHVLAIVLNPTRWQFTNSIVLVGMGVLGLVWLRYLVETYHVVPQEYLSKVVPVSTVLGFLALALSPLYSQWLAGRFFSVFGIAATGGGYGVIGGTVAENAPAGVTQVVGQLGSARIPGLFQLLAVFFGNAVNRLPGVVSGWTLAVIGLSVMAVIVGLMLLRKYFGVDEVPARLFYLAAPLLLFFTASFQSINGSPFAQSTFFVFFIALIGAGVLSLYPRDAVSVPDNWYYVVLMVWAATAIFGVVNRSRLMFIAAQPVSLFAGFALASGVAALRDTALWQRMADRSAEVEASRIFFVAIFLVLVPVVVAHTGAASAMAAQMGGGPQPYQLWMENLDYMRTETPVDSVILSWWDYGYWFQSLGGRASIADGGNLGHMEIFDVNGKINYPLADFLTAEDYTEHLPWLESMSVDYVVLDSSMIGKYSAVSQIHNRDNTQFTSLQSFGCQQQQVSVQGQTRRVCMARQAQNNQTYLFYNAGSARFLVPVNSGLYQQLPQPGGRTVLFPVGSPAATVPVSPVLFQGPQGTAVISNFCSTQGIIEFPTPEEQPTLPGCVAWHPYSQHQQLVYIPEDAMQSTLVRLYIMDGYNMPEFEKRAGGSNGFVKMWEYVGDDTA